jgi:hypothetical protein
MKRAQKERGMVPQYALVAGVVIAFLSLIGVAIAPTGDPLAALRMDPQSGLVIKDKQFPVRILVDASTTVNVFKGELRFDPTKLRVASIDYNVSIAELWAERPWYANGEGTINFIGGTTRPGGFLGSGTLMTIMFEPIATGDAELTMEETRILAHDGLGSDVPLRTPIDALFTVAETEIAAKTVASTPPQATSIAVVESFSKTDLNQDGKQTIADMSIFVTGLVTQDPTFDFNNDGSVDTKDLSIIMSAK